jgi:hypothetical protein
MCARSLHETNVRRAMFSPNGRYVLTAERSRPLMVALEVWLREQRAKLSGQSSVSKATAWPQGERSM